MTDLVLIAMQENVKTTAVVEAVMKHQCNGNHCSKFYAIRRKDEDPLKEIEELVYL